MKFFNQIWQIPDFWNFPYFIGLAFTLLCLWALTQQWNYISKFFFIYLLIIIPLGLFTSFPAKAFMPLSLIIPLLWMRIPFHSHFWLISITFLTSLFFMYSNKKEFENQFHKHFQAYDFAHQVLKIFPNNLQIQIDISPFNDTDMYWLNLRHAFHQQGYTMVLENQSSLRLEGIEKPTNKKVILQDSNMRLVVLQ